MTKLIKTQAYMDTVFSEENKRYLVHETANMTVKAVQQMQEPDVDEIVDTMLRVFITDNAIKAYREMLHELIALDDEQLKEAVRTLAHRQTKQAQEIQKEMMTRIMQILNKDDNDDLN